MRFKRWIIAVVVFIALAAIWQIMASLQLYNTELLPPPSKSFAAVYKLWQDGTLTSDFGASMGRYIPGFFIGSLAGIIVGVVTGMFRSASYAVNPPFHYLRSIPPVALIPFMLVVFGIGNIGKISLVAWACMFPVWLSTQAGMKQVPKEYLQAAKTFGVDGIRRVLHVWLPCSLPHIVSGLRIAVSTGLFALAAAEMFAASSGIGFRIVYSYQLFQTDAMVGMILFLGFIAFVADALLLGLRALVARWESA